MTGEVVGWIALVFLGILYVAAEARAKSDPNFDRWWNGPRR